MIFEQIAIDGDKNFAYLIADESTRRGAVVDPGVDPGRVLRRVRELDLSVQYILATHSHYDHIAGVDMVKRRTGAPLAAHPAVPGVDRPLNDGDTLRLGDSVEIRAIHCPGHCADSVILLVNEAKAIVGDELFIGGVGITRSEEQARLHHHNLHHVLMRLPDHVEVYPGHDYGAKPCSTIGEQRRTNPYLLQPDFDRFWHLRRNWKQYCAEHGIQWG